MAVMTPRPAQPDARLGPAGLDALHVAVADLHYVFQFQVLDRTSSRTRSMTVFCALAWRMRRVESALGSQPTIITFLPSVGEPCHRILGCR